MTFLKGLDDRVRETVKNELESLLLWLGPNLPRSEEIMQNQIVCRSPGIKSTSSKVILFLREPFLKSA